MKQIHRQEKKQFLRLFEQEGIDHIEERFQVLEIFLQTESHLTGDELIRLLKENGVTLEPDFVKETLAMMHRFGFARRNRFNNGEIRYEHRHLGQHHDHIICTKCRSVIEFENTLLEELQTRIAVEHGFYMLQHKMEIYGLCEQCQTSRLQIIPLVMAKQGERLSIHSLSGGRRARMRLTSMGLRVGDSVEIVANNNGQLVVALDCKRYVLGKGLAQKIMVQSSGQYC
ncbi:transcriptional repressor [Desulfococcaceae bacterium HSG9]|nr:transcriptional repressor [Desulfococcaceae bacterium HSG9]